jgi:hypothetical protein
MSLIWNMRITAEEIETRATEALVGYIGNMSTVRMNLEDVLKIARKYELASSPDVD